MICAEAPTSKYVVNASMLYSYTTDWMPISSYNPSGDPAIELPVDTTSFGTRFRVTGGIWPQADPTPASVIPQAGFFQLLLDRWHVERGATSSITEMAMCRAHLRIIGMGPSVVPLILRKMQEEGDEPDMWFVALQMLTGKDPVTDEIRGDFKAMADRWLQWAADCGYVW
jgi:hypothetical protein